MPDDGDLSLDELYDYASPHLANGHSKELMDALRHLAVTPILIAHGRLSLAKDYLGNARKYSQFTGEVPKIEGYLAILDDRVKNAQAHRP